ncbi:MAG: hypothetical protein MSO56_01360 [Clostridiales bacterium]|nr:hypothetical protein [Clostridiales bacterium]
MKSKTSLFNKGVALNLLKRYWPLWLGYFVLLLLVTPAVLSGRVDRLAPGEMLNYTLLNTGVDVVYISMVVGVLSAMAMFNYLYSTKSCGMMNMLPIRRETMFLTAFLTGLMPLLAADVLVMLITALFYGGRLVYFKTLLLWLAMAVMGNISFYGFAVFCAVLTGNLVVLPVLYLVLNLTVYVAERAVRYLLGAFVYGMNASSCTLLVLSPIMELLNSLAVMPVNYIDADGMVQAVTNAYQVNGLGVLGIYCAAGLVCAALALLIYRRRQMERATDVVAVPVLKPVFKYCMTFGTAVVLAFVVYDWLVPGNVSGIAAALLVLALLLVGALIGYYAAEMLMRKTLKVFPGKWKGCLVSCLILAVLTMAWEFDLFGYERRIPEADQVESAWFLGNNTELTEPENIQALTQLHQSLVDNKSENESADERYIVTIRYMLKDGGTLIRRYPIRCDREALNDPDSDIRRYEALENVEEARIRRIVPSFPVTITNISYGDIYMSWRDEEGNYQGESLSLTDEQVFALYQCIRKDLEAGTAGRLWVGESDAYLDTVSTIDINLEFVTGTGEDQKWSYIYETLCLDEENAMNWIRENTDFTVMTQRELYEEESGEPAAEFIY